VWVKNCIGLGLSTGFIEPLESTSIHLIMIAVTRLLQMFPYDGVSDAAADRFNFLAERELEGIRDFIVLHYHATERDDSDFWRHCRTMAVPDSLAQRLALFREQAHVFQESHDLFACRKTSCVSRWMPQGRMSPGLWSGCRAIRTGFGDMQRLRLLRPFPPPTETLTAATRD
jgi:tryptophan halogenase